MTVMRRAVIATVLACTSVVGAQPASNKAKADAAYAEGQKSYAAGDYASAAQKFEAAYALDPDPAYLFNIAQAYRLGNACAKAATAYRTFLAEVPDAPNAAKVKQFIEQSDDCAKTQTPVPPPVDEARPPPARTDLVPPPSPPPSPPPPTGRPGRAQRLAGVVVGGFGAAGLGVAVYFTVKASDYTRQREHLCSQEIADTGTCAWTTERDTREDELNDKGERAQLAARIAWTVGGAAVLGGVALYLLAPSAAAEGSAMTIVPSQGGAMAVGTFRF